MDEQEEVLRAAYGADTPPGTASQPPEKPSRWDPAHWSTKAKAALAGGFAVLVLAVVLAVVLWPSGGVPSTVHGTVTSTTLSVLGQDPSNCILALPDEANQVLLKGDGVVVATAQIGKSFHSYKNGSGEVCWVDFTFTGVPGGKTLYAVAVNVSRGSFGCQGTVYYKPAKLSKSLNIDCS